MIQYAKPIGRVALNYGVPAISSYANTRARNNYRRYNLRGNRTAFDSFSDSLPRVAKSLPRLARGLFFSAFLILIFLLILKGLKGFEHFFTMIKDAFSIFDNSEKKAEKKAEKEAKEKQREEIANQNVVSSKMTITITQSRNIAKSIHNRLVGVSGYGKFDYVKSQFSKCKNEYDLDAVFNAFGIKTYNHIIPWLIGERSLKGWLEMEFAKDRRAELNRLFFKNTIYELVTD